MTRRDIALERFRRALHTFEDKVRPAVWNAGELAGVAYWEMVDSVTFPSPEEEAF